MTVAPTSKHMISQRQRYLDTLIVVTDYGSMLDNIRNEKKVNKNKAVNIREKGKYHVTVIICSTTFLSIRTVILGCKGLFIFIVLINKGNL